jgi:tRNA nucleotidyltransferase (CCA-adding enzyme)
VQFSPAAASGRILNFYGGLADLRAGLIRVLHNLSFVDDPTRMLRAVRFEQRLNFQIEPRTVELMETALPMLGRITGERVRNELSLILREKEPERPLLELQKRGILEAIHPALKVDAAIAATFKAGRTEAPPWPMDEPDSVALNWHLIAARLSAEQLTAICERLLMPQTQTETMLATAKVVALLDWLDGPALKPSQVDGWLSGTPDIALWAAWLVAPPISQARAQIEQFATTWRHVRPKTNGHTLQSMKLRPGPCFGLLLNRLRTARLDGDIESDEDEHQLLLRLIDEGVCDGSA